MRKTSIFICLLLVFVLLAGCAEHKYKESDTMVSLQKVFILCEDSPRVALNMLESIPDKNLTTEEKMYYDLVRVRVNDKNEIRQTSDSLMKRVWDYYKDRDDDTLKVISAYYMGRVYYNLYDSPKALEYYLLAAETAERNKQVRNLWKYYIHAQISTLYERHDMNTMALDSYLKGMSYLKERIAAKDSIWVYIDIGNAYGANMQKDSANTYYDKAIDCIKRHDKWTERNGQIGYIIYNYLWWGWDDKADELTGNLLAKVPADSLTPYCTGVIGDYYFHRGNREEAERFIKRSYSTTSDLNDSISMAMSLMLLYSDGAHHDSLRKYVGQYLNIQAEHDAKTREEALVRRSNLYKYYYDKAEVEHIKNVALMRKNIIYMASIAFLLVLIGLILFGRKTYQKLRDVMRSKEQEHQKKSAELEESLSEKEQKIRSLASNLSRSRKIIKDYNLLKNLSLQAADSTRKKFENVARTGKRELLSEEDWYVLIETNKERLSPIIKEMENNSTEYDAYRILILRALGYSFSSIENITGIPSSTAHRKIQSYKTLL